MFFEVFWFEENEHFEESRLCGGHSFSFTKESDEKQLMVEHGLRKFKLEDAIPEIVL